MRKRTNPADTIRAPGIVTGRPCETLGFMNIESLLQGHVYTAIVVGSLVEGETTVVLAGFAAHQGYASWWSVTLLAAAINFCWDQVYFALGRWRGAWLIHRSSHLAAGIERMRPYLARRRRWVIFGVRFMYGLRTAGPVALGIADTPWREFVLFNALGALTWAALFSALGFVFGRTLSTLVGEIAHYEAEAVLAIFAVGLGAYLLHHVRTRHSKDRA